MLNNATKKKEDYVITLEVDCYPSFNLKRFVSSTLNLDLHDERKNSRKGEPVRFACSGSEKQCRIIWRKYFIDTQISRLVTIRRIKIERLKTYKWFDKSAIDETTKKWKQGKKVNILLQN